MPGQDVDHRTRPRRRGAALVGAILAATRAELREGGYPALTMEAVAQRAGASKASLYRRWDTRAALVMDAVYDLAPVPAEIPDTGELRGDLLEVLRRTAATLSGPAGAALRGLLAEALADQDRVRELRARSQGRNRQLMAEVLRRAATRGEVSADAAAPARLDVGAALLRNHFLLEDRPLDEAVLLEVVDDVLLPLFHSPRHGSN
ncbi:TetR/AcrR family transcriptional regulator [Arthrobacter sp. JSM 101049]|uniref:TetR/AcrR family transcriptional regulator n=1 Tax=Arthrobacter sp. JSM 101049 TaxID=929097 RepID=UPI00356468BB